MRVANQGHKCELNRVAFAFMMGIAALFLPAVCQAQQYLLSIYAGTGASGYSGNGGPATGAKLNSPYGVAADSFGNLYISDYANHSVRKVAAIGGAISTVAGSDSMGYTGDHGPAINATLNHPEGLAVDTANNLYIVDSGNQVIRMVSGATGIITTLAGGGNGCPQQTDSVGDGCPALNSELNDPTGVAVDSAGNVYIADRFNFRIRKVSGGIISNFAGTGRNGYSGDGGLATNAQLAEPYGVAVDSNNLVYIADTGNELIRRVDLKGDINTIAGTSNSQGFFGDGSPAVDAKLNQPTAVAVDASGNVFISDTQNSRIREILVNGNITTIAGSGSCNINITPGPALNTPLCSQVFGVAVFGTSVYIPDQEDNQVFLLAPAVPPAAVTVFAPPQGATNVSITPILTWGPASGATSYDVYFGTAQSPPFVENTVSTSYSPISLNPNTTYYWYLIAKNNSGSTPSAIWSFTTGNVTHPSFFAGEVYLGNGVYYLKFPNGNVFGYYNYQFFPILYHYDLGFEYFQDANDGKGGAYFYDFASGHWFYTSPLYPFPYLYDFTLHSILYYYPNANSPGHYTTLPRDFYNFATGQIITM